MRILFFSPYFYPYTSGITTYPLKILSYLAKKHKITVLTFPHAANLPTNERLKGFDIVRIPYLFKVTKGFISPQSLLSFYKSLNGCDLVILNIPNFEGFPLAILAKIMGKRIISIFHCEIFLSKRFSDRLIKFFLNTSVYLQMIVSKTIVAYTEDYINSLPISKLFKNKIKYILPPIEKLPIDIDKLDYFKKLKGKKIWIGYAGRISREKGLEHLINALHLTGVGEQQENLDENKIELVFAGPYGKNVVGENNYFLKVKEMLQRNKISYHFFGNLTSGSLGAFYKAIDLLVLPSVNQTEAFGMVQVEAMLLGTPVITSNLPGVRIPIQLTRMGETFKPGSSPILEKLVKKVIANRKIYTNEKLIKNAERLFDIDKVFHFYDKLIS